MQLHKHFSVSQASEVASEIKRKLEKKEKKKRKREKKKLEALSTVEGDGEAEVCASNTSSDLNGGFNLGRSVEEK